MPDFIYTAIDKYGKEKKGNITADTMEIAFERIRSEGLTPVKVDKANLLNKEISINIGSGVKPRDLSVFCRQFISMITAGVTIIDAFGMLEEQTENKVMKRAIENARTEIEKGETLSNALAKSPKVFPDVMIKMVAAGEASGKIEVAFTRMAEHFEKSARLAGIVKKAAVYPIVVAVVAVIVIVVMLVMIVPSYTEMFDQIGTELPALTRGVVAASNFLMTYWYFVVGIIVAIVVAYRAFAKTPQGQEIMGLIARKAPVFGNLTIKSASSNFARTLSTLIYSGLPMVEALAITAGTMTNYLYKKKLEEARDEVMKGIPLSEPLLRDDLFPPMVGHMAKIGEETGQIEDMLTRLADYYDEEVEMATQTVIAAVEPMIILVLAAVVCVILGAVLSPMLAMYNNMDNL